MKKKNYVLDSNILLRFLTKDDDSQYLRVHKLFMEAEDYSLEIPDTVICEIYFVLDSYYELSKEDILEILKRILSFNKFKLNRKIIKATLQYFEVHNISFLDSYLCARSDIQDTVLVTFDKGIFKAKKNNIKVI